MNILALDLSIRRTGACWGEPGANPTFTSESFFREGEEKSMDGVAEACSRAIVWVSDLTTLNKFDRAVIEAPIPEAALGYSTNAWSTAGKFALIGVVSGAIRCRGIPLRFGNIQRVRKFFIGRGNVKGDVAKPAVFKVCNALGWSPENYDEGDSAALWCWQCNEVAPRLVPHLDPISLGIDPFDFSKPRRVREDRSAA